MYLVKYSYCYKNDESETGYTSKTITRIVNSQTIDYCKKLLTEYHIKDKEEITEFYEFIESV